MKDLANAIKDLIIEYDKACKSEWVQYPIGYALYKTWKKYDLIKGTCENCALDLTDACIRGAGRAVDDEICDMYIDKEKNNGKID